MRFRGVIFDVDGVLVDSPHERAWRESLQRLMEGPWRAIVPQTSYTPERYTTEVYQAYVAGKPREAGARAALDYFGVPDPDGRRLREYCDTKQADLIELIEQGKFVAFDDALRFLLDLKAAGVKVGAASSSKNANMLLGKVSLARFADTATSPASSASLGAGHDPASAEMGAGKRTDSSPLPSQWEQQERGRYPFLGPNTTLLELFDANVCGRDFAHGKPAADIFLAAAAELNLPAERCVVVEDATSGVQAAKAGGMACVGVARLGDELLLESAGADWVVTSLDELPVAKLLEPVKG